jgi:hypothetical protein
MGGHFLAFKCSKGYNRTEVNEFNYLGYKLSFVGELDLPGKISKYSKIMGVINNVLKPSLVQKQTRIRIYKTLARPMLCYGSEAWTIRKSDKSRITACEISSCVEQLDKPNGI